MYTIRDPHAHVVRPSYGVPFSHRNLIAQPQPSYDDIQRYHDDQSLRLTIIFPLLSEKPGVMCLGICEK